MDKNKVKELRSKSLAEKATLEADAETILAKNEFTDEDKKNLEGVMSKLDGMNAKLDAMSKIAEDEQEEEKEEDEGENAYRSAPAFLRSRGRKSAPANVTEHAAREGYSLSRAVDTFLNKGSLTGVEAEVDQELARRQSRNGSFLAPLGDMDKLNRRDLTLSTGAGAIPVYWEGFVDFLYPLMVGPRLGFKYLNGLDGVTNFPRQTTAAIVSAVAEQGSASASSLNLDDVVFTPRTITGNCTISRKFATQSVVSADRYVMEALAKQIAVTMDFYAIAGSGSSNQPLGLFNNTAITNVQVATSNLVSWTDTVQLEKLVAKSNANFGNLGYLTSPSGKAKLRTTPKIGSTYPVFLIDDNDKINAHPVIDSTQVSDSLTYTGTTGLTLLAYGNWADLAVGTFFDGLSIIVDPYSGSKTGNVTITALLDMDTNVMHPGSFAICPNVSP